MPYQSLGLGALIVNAIRAKLTDPALQAQVAAVQTGFASLTARLDAAISANDTVDSEQTSDLTGIKEELLALQTALTGPVDDPTDNGVIGEVEPAPDAEPSPAADAIVEEGTGDGGTDGGTGDGTGDGV